MTVKSISPKDVADQVIKPEPEKASEMETGLNNCAV